MADVDVKELLGAYLAGDIRPEERAAVERLLSDDPETRAVLESLRDVLGSVQGADRTVTPAMTRQLRERLAPLLTDDVTSAALGSALAGELTGVEQEQLKRYLREHPQEKARMSAMRDTAQWMKKNQPVATDAMSAALRSRLAAQIPALRGLDSQVSRETTFVRTPTLPASVTQGALPAKPAPRATSSLRVVAKDDPWKRRFAWGAAAAAASVALAFGIAKVFESPKHEIVTGVKNGNVPEVAPKQNEPQPEPQNVPQPDQKIVEVEGPKLLPREPQQPIVNIDPPPNNAPKLPAPQQPEVVERDPRVKPVVPQEPRDPFTPKKSQSVPQEVTITDPKTQVKPETTIPDLVPPRAPEVNVADGRSTQGIPIGVGPSVIPPRPPSNSVSNVPNNTLNGGDEVSSNTTKTTDQNPPKAATADVPRDGMTVVSVKSGSVSAKSEGGEAQTLSAAQNGTQLASGTEFVTSQTSRIILDLPDGRLWINVSSLVKVKVSGTATTVELSGGQLAFESSKGSLTVLTAGQTIVTAAKNVDVRLENGALVAVVLGERATVKGKKVERGQQATVANPAGSDAPKITPVENDNATRWRTDGEPAMAPANDAAPKTKSKSKSRRV